MEQVANSGDSAAGFYAGPIAFGLILLACLGMSIRWCRRPGTNRLGALSLALVFAAIFIMAVCGMVMRFWKDLAPLAGLAMMPAVGLLCLAGIFALVSLHQLWIARRMVPGSGHRQAMAALVICSGLCGLAAVGAWRAIRQRQMSLVGQPAGLDSLRFEGLGFAIEPPGRPWVALDAKKFNSAATVFLRRVRPEIIFMVIAEDPGPQGDMTTATLVEVCRANLRSTAASVEFIGEGTVELDGCLGKQLESDAMMGASRTFSVYHLLVREGFVYQLVTTGAHADREQVRAEAGRFAKRFRYMGRGAGEVTPEDFRPPRGDYAVRLKGRSWHPWASMGKDLPEAEFGIMTREGMCLAVVPLDFGSVEPDLDAATSGLLSALDMTFPSEELSLEDQRANGGIEERRFSATREVGGKPYRYILRVIRNGSRCFLAASWSREPVAEDVLRDLAQLVEVEARPPDRVLIDTRPQFNMATMFNQAGLSFFRRGEFLSAGQLFERAAALAPHDPVFAENVVAAMKERGALSEAARAVGTHLSRFPRRYEGLILRAEVLAKGGDAAAAIDAYRAALEVGVLKPGDLWSYVCLLAEAGRADEALEAMEERLRAEGSLDLRIWKGLLLEKLGRQAEAIGWLEGLRSGHPRHETACWHLARLLNDTGDHLRAIEMCDEMIGASVAVPRFLSLRGNALRGLGRYREARAAFEEALRRAPGDQEAEAAVKQLAAIIGQSDNRSISGPIEPLPLPEGIASVSGGSPPGYADGASAHYVWRYRICRFDPGGSPRATTYERIRVNNRQGVRDFNTMLWAFDPLVERVFVNRLDVLDDRGAVLASASRDDFYVLDNAPTEQATDSRVLNMPVPALEPGNLIDLVVTTEKLGAWDAAPLERFEFSRSLPVLSSVLVYLAPPGALRASVVGGVPCRPLGDSGHWWSMPFPPVWRFEYLQTDSREWIPNVAVGPSSTTWAKEAGEYIERIRDRLEISREIRQLADEITGGQTDVRGCIRSLTAYVQAGLTYKAIEFGARGTTPHAPAQTISNKYGDCKDHAVLLRALLGAKGIPSQLALIDTSGPVCEDMPTLDQFDHMILHVPANGPSCFIDATMRELPADRFIPMGLAGRRALILADEPSFQTVEAANSGRGTVRIDRRIAVGPGGVARATESLELVGQPAAYYRSVLRRVPPDRQAQQIEWQMQSEGYRATVTGVSFGGLDELEEPFRLRLEYELPGRFHRNGDGTWVGQVPAFAERFFLDLPRVANRRSPFRWLYALDVASSTRVERADLSGGVGGGAEIAARTLRGNIRIERAKDGLSIVAGAHPPLGSFPAADYPEAVATAGKFLKGIEMPIGVRDDPVPVSPPTGHP